MQKAYKTKYKYIRDNANDKAIKIESKVKIEIENSGI